MSSWLGECWAVVKWTLPGWLKSPASWHITLSLQHEDTCYMRCVAASTPPCGGVMITTAFRVQQAPVHPAVGVELCLAYARSVLHTGTWPCNVSRHDEHQRLRLGHRSQMSSKLALKQLQSLQESRERPNGDKEIKKAIRKKKRSNKKQVQARQQLQAAKDSSSKLEYYKSTTSAQKVTAEIMSKLLGQPLPQEESDSDLDLDLDF